MAWTGSLTELEAGFSLTQPTYNLQYILVEDREVEFCWIESEGKFEVTLRKNFVDGMAIWSGEMTRVGIGDTGSLSMVLYKLADGNLVMVGTWVFGRDEGVYLLEAYRSNADDEQQT